MPMNLTGLRDAQKRDRFVSQLRKRWLQAVRVPRPSKPVFVFGKQRSGTNMIMYAFHRHPEAMVWDEHRDSRVFVNFRVRSLDVIRKVIEESCFPIVCFKPICDSHMIKDFIVAFPDAHHVWMYRDYADTANSALRKFATPNRALRLVCTGQPGGGWFAEGVSTISREILSRVYHEGLSEFDLSCLVWWARNRIIVESGLLTSPDVTLVRYESIVSRPDAMFRWLFARIGISYCDAVVRRVTDRSIGRHQAPEMDAAVRDLCSVLLRELDVAFAAQAPPVAGVPIQPQG
jgi:hypothetical protein